MQLVLIGFVKSKRLLAVQCRHCCGVVCQEMKKECPEIVNSHGDKSSKTLEDSDDEHVIQRAYLGFGANLFAKDLMEKIMPYMSLNSCSR